MRMSRAAAAESKARLVKAAAKLLRRDGVEAASVFEVCEAAGMTHGGFYKHFESKDDLIAQGAAAAFAEVVQRFDDRAAEAGARAAADLYIADYLSDGHVAHPEFGCPVAALGIDAGRRPEALGPVFAQGVEALIARLSRAEGSRTKAINKAVALVGAVIAARAVGGGALADEILNAVRGVRDDDAG